MEKAASHQIIDVSPMSWAMHERDANDQSWKMKDDFADDDDGVQNGWALLWRGVGAEWVGECNQRKYLIVRS